MNTPFQNEGNSSSAPDGKSAGPYDEMSRILADLPRPRPVRITRRGKIIAVMVLAALLASIGIYASANMMVQRSAGGQSAGPSQFPAYALSIAFIVAFAIVMLNVIGRQKALLAGGEMAMARVTKRGMARNGPNIYYEFTTPLGEHFARGAADSSGQLAVGMNVPVFYDPQSPKKQLALCASFYELVLPGKE